MNTKILGRVTLALGAVLLVSLFAWEACSDELSIVQIHRSIPLSDDEPVYKDIYINGGSNSGLKNNLVISVYRKVIVKDATGSQPIGELLAPVGQLKVIFVGPKVAIAREYKSAQPENTPSLDQPGFQLGDTVELKGSFVDYKKKEETSVVATPKNPADNAGLSSSAVQTASMTTAPAAPTLTSVPVQTTPAQAEPTSTEHSATNIESTKAVSEAQREPSSTEVH